MRNLKPLLFLSLLSLILPAKSLAADFNPHSIITDTELQDYQSLGRDEIRSFLANRNSALLEMVLPDYEGKNRYASEIIYRASQEYKINPKYLLVKLQKEQSLVTTKNPTERQLNWATGYGACDSCDTTDPRLDKYKGFGKQVDAAAGIMRWYYDNAGTKDWIKTAGKTYTIDDTEVTPTSNATGFLYTYTPHLHGNENFWKLWNNWFAASYPDGTLLRSTSSPAIYVLANNQKRPIKTMAVLVSRYNPKLIITAPDSELNKYSTGAPIAFSNYSILKVDGQYYLLDYETARPFASAEVVQKLGYNPDEIIEANSSDLADFTIGETISLDAANITGKLVKIATEYYYLKGTGYYTVAEPAIATARFPGIKAVAGKVSDFTNLTNLGPLLFPDASLVGSKLTKAVYVIDKGKKRLVPSEVVFTGLGYQWKNVIMVADSTLDQYPTGEALYYDALPKTTTSTTKLSVAVATSAFTKDLGPGANKQDILFLQQTLKAWGFLSATPNGTYGPATVAAVKKFQTASKIKALGTVGPTTRAALNKKLNAVTSVSTNPTPIAPKYVYFDPATTGPIDFQEVGKMFAVTTTATQIVGPEFTTNLDTYLVAKLINGEPEIVASKNAQVQRPLASLTKVMTALVLMDNNLNLDLATTFDTARHYAPSGNLFPIHDGDVILNRDLLSALLVSSFNRAAVMLVDATGRTVPEFVAQMNEKAQTLGLSHTYFFDPHGYNQHNQATAEDYVKIFLEATKNPLITSYLSTATYQYTEISSTDKTTSHGDLNSNRLLLNPNLPYSIEATKTGFLNEAGFNLAMKVTRKSDGQQFMILSMGNPNYAQKYSETDRLTQWALSNF